MPRRIAGVLVALLSLLAQAEILEDTGFIPTHDGTRLYYRKLGGGPQKVIIPGGFLFYRDFDRFASPERTVILYDMRNRGRSEAVKDQSRVSMENDVRDLETVRTHFGIEKASLIGYSYLGFMVVLYAKDHPDHVERIIQLGPVPRQWNTEYPAQLTNKDSEQVVDKRAQGELKELRKQGYSVSHPKVFCEKQWEVERVLLVGNPSNAEKLASRCDLPNEWPVNFEKHLEASFGSVQKMKVSKEEVARVTVPVLTIHGTKDRNAPYGAGREWALTLPNARLVTVPGAAHQSWADEPELVFGSIETFLRGDWPREAEKITSLDVSRNGHAAGASNRLAENQEAQMEADILELKAKTREFVEGFNSGDVDRIMRFYADTYVDINLRQPVQTKAERREYYRKIMERRDTKVDVIPEEIMVHGEYAFERGTILLTRTQPGGAAPKQLELRYLEVERKFPDGWKAIWGMDAELYPDQQN